MLQYEGKPEYSEEDSIVDSTDDDEDYAHDIHFTAVYLSDKAFIHCQTANLNESNDNDEAKTNLPQLFLLDRYNREIFQGILPDTGAANTSTAGKNQVEALQLQDPSVTIDTSKAGEAKLRFGNGNIISSNGVTKINTPVGKGDFHVMDTPTPFLLSLKDIDRLGVHFNNLTNEIICVNRSRIPVLRKWGHPWFFLNKDEATAAFLTEAELRRIHSRPRS